MAPSPISPRARCESGASGDLHAALSKFGLVFKLAYTYGCRSWITAFVMAPFLGTKRNGDAAKEVAELRYSIELMIEMLVANGSVLPLISVALGTLVAVTIQSLRARQVDLITCSRRFNHVISAI